MHFGQWSKMRRVSKIVGIFSSGQRRAGCRFNRDHPDFASTPEHFPDEGKDDPGEVGSASGTADHHVRVVSGHFHLLDGFQSDDRLVGKHVIQNASQRVFHVVVLCRHLNRF